MQSRTPCLATLALAGCLALLPANTALAYEAGRCNIAEGNVHRMVLLVRKDGETHIHRPGTDGLTRRVLHNPQALADWTAARYGAAPAQIAACTSTGGGGRLAAVAAPGPVAAGGGGGGTPVTVTAPGPETPPTGNDSGAGGTSDGQDQL